MWNIDITVFWFNKYNDKNPLYRNYIFEFRRTISEEKRFVDCNSATNAYLQEIVSRDLIAQKITF